MKIRNFAELATTPLRRSALEIAEAGLQAIDTKSAIRAGICFENNVLTVRGEQFPVSEEGRIFVVGVGKCAVDAAEALEGVLDRRLTGGAVIDVKSGAALTRLKGFQGTHPLPSGENVKAAQEIVRLLRALDGNDLVVFIISGGGSTLLCLPEDVGCEEEANIWSALTRAGASIQEINIVRKHLSLARGGYLAKYAYPARVISLVFSDVPGDDLQFIASGPTVRDATTIEDAARILSEYDVLRVCGMERCGLVETPKEDKYFECVSNILFVSNGIALGAMAAKAWGLGYAAEVRDKNLSGEAAEAGKNVAGELHEAQSKTVFLYGGETTVTVRGTGRGGRNQELALGALMHLKEGEGALALASDGRDNGSYAGALCDTMIRDRARDLGLDAAAYLENNDAGVFFERTGGLVMTGDTGSNVSDLVIAVKE